MNRSVVSLVACLLLCVQALFAEDEPPEIRQTPAEVDPAAIPSLVNLTSMPSAIVNGCVNVISGDLCESAEEDVIFWPDPYVLGHTYFSSSLEEGNLGDGWNFLHHHLIEVFQPDRISYTKGAPFSVPYLLPIGAFDALIRKGIEDAPADRTPTLRESPLHGVQDRHHDAKNYHDHNDNKKNTTPPYVPSPIFLSLYEPAGGRLLFKTKYDEHHKKRSLRHFKLESSLSGYTNVVGGRMSGKTCLKNIELKWDKQKDAFEVTLGDGTRRVYERQWKTHDMKDDDSQHAKYYRDYHLHKEVKPNGNIVVYDYNDKYEIVKVRSYNKNLSHKLFSVKFDQRTTGDFAKHHSLHVKTSDGFEHTYHFKKLKGSYMHGTYSVDRIRRQGHPFTKYTYSKKSPRHDRRVIRKETEDGFYIDTKYYRPAENWMDSREVTPKNKKETKFLRNRVRMQRSPVGPNGQKAITHRYFYYKDNPGAGHCTVRDAYNNVSRYYWNKDKRLVAVTKNDSNNARLMSEKYFWGEDGTNDEGRLLSRILEDENHEPVLARTFSYDSRGNVIEDALYTRITENSGKLRLNDDGMPYHESCDRQITLYTYSRDGFNLLESECDPLGNYTYYEYVKGTNLLEAKFICDGKHVRRREFFDYDVNGICVQHIVDDGHTKDKENFERVTERHITKTTPRYVRPRFGEPEEILEFFYNFEEGKEAFLKKTVNHFNEKGFVIKRELEDQLGGITAYEYAYDDIGRVIYSKDPLGQTEHIEYDKAGRVIKKTGHRDDVSWHYTYDKAGRLIQETEKHASGLELTTRYEYDLLSRKTAVTDPQNNTTRYEYDALNRVTSITYPPIYDHTGAKTVPTKTYKYKHLGTKVFETDENGLTTKTTYNALGKPCKKKFPDKTRIFYKYDIKGNLVKEVAPNGATNHIEYDAFDRVRHSSLKMNNDLLCKKEVIYNNFHAVREIGPTGEVTSYTYDNAGRVAAIELGGERMSKYVYDAKGCIYRERTFLANGGFVGKRYMYDALNRVTYESVRDDKERVRTYKNYGYDSEGNRNTATQNIEGKEVTSYATYHPKGLPESQTDAEGNTTLHRYNYYYKNAHGQMVVSKETIDAKGMRMQEVYDARGSLSVTSCYDPQGVLLAKKRLFYDPAGNCLRVHEYAISNAKIIKKVVTLFNYDKGRLAAITEAAGTPEEKATHYTYNEFGQKQSVIYSDGTALEHEYDAKGRLKRYFSSDNTLDYSYEYDASDRILAVVNNLTGKKTAREYNRYGELKRETLETGLTLTYSYDNAGRPTLLTLPDGSKVAYEHSAFFEKITRLGKDGKERYSHSVVSRDKSGFIKSALLANGSTIAHAHDSLGRNKRISHPLFEQKAKRFDAVGNLLTLKTTDAEGTYRRDFSYDFLSQLTREEGPTASSYTYDSLYNRLSHNESSYEVNSLHAVLTDSKRAFSYDARGNRLSLQKDNSQTRYKYDALDRLIEVELPEGERWVYTYDGFNRRTQKEAFKAGPLGWKKKSVVKYIYALDNEIGSTDEHNALCELRVLGEGLGAEIGAAVALELNGTTYVPLHDRQGNVATLVDLEGNVVEHYRYDAFGQEVLVKNAEAPINPWRFSSKRVDPETGMVNFGRRYYDPTLGKWLTQDPLGLKAGPNLYAYCVNNPMTKFDSYGLYVEEGYNPRNWRPYECQNPQVRSAYQRRIEQTYKDKGYLTQGSPFSKNQKKYLSVPLIDRPDYPGGSLYYMPGMNTSFSRQIEQAMYLSDLSGGYKIDVIQNFTHTLAFDVPRAFLEKYGRMPTEASQDLKDKLTETYTMMGPYHKNFIISFSESAIIADNALTSLPKQITDTCHVVAVCPGKFIPETSADTTVNIVNKNPLRDPIPHLDSLLGPIGHIHRKESSCNVIYKNSHPNADFFDHDIASPTYRQEIHDEFQNFKQATSLP